MLIKTKTVTAGDGAKAVSYVLAPGENEQVFVLEGTPENALMADEFAMLCDQKTGLLHNTINPGMYELADADREHSIAAIKAEYGVPQESPHLLVEHQKFRKDGTLQRHLHLFMQAQDARGNLVNTWRSKKRDELLSRFMEIELGHRITPGRHNAWVHEKMIERSLDRHAAIMDEFKEVVKVARYTEVQNQRSKRLGFNIDYFTSELTQIAELPRDEQARKVAELIDKFEDCGIEAGTKRSRILLQHPSGEKAFNINKILKIEAHDTGNFIKEVGRYLDNDCIKPGREHPGTSDQYDKATGKVASNQHSDSGEAECPASDHPQSDEELEITNAARDLRANIRRFSDNRASDVSAADIEAAPDIDDPHLMLKLSRQLKKSLSTRKIGSVLEPTLRPAKIR
ncbi:hypothetical protein [Ruegeria atlantica]|uniref:hypothetical protein n=1 Tax=Ruegeria atlantica TaxID=81569 RepID=UPI00147DCD12|nr:hypothetical protein [Ruegeria atlantica]